MDSETMDEPMDANINTMTLTGKKIKYVLMRSPNFQRTMERSSL